ncbi:hypothetical protein ACFX2G_030896 [Malus domestica]
MKSSAKEIAFDQHFQHALQGGIDKLGGVIGLTFGPRGRNVVLDECGCPKVVNEGVKFGKAIELPHNIGTVGEARIREYKDGKRMGAFVNLFFQRELTLKSFDVEKRAMVAVELQTCLFTSVALPVLRLHNLWSYASSIALKVEPSTTLLLSTKEVLVQKLLHTSSIGSAEFSPSFQE